MKIFTLFIMCFLPVIASLQAQSTIDFEAGGNGASYTWTVFESDTPPFAVVDNPNAAGVNNSSTTAKMSVLVGNANYAGVVTRSITPFTLSSDNCIVKIMVYKDVISDVGIKFEANFASTGEIKVANTKINEWEELTFDFSSKIGEASSTNIDALVIFPDFNARTQNTLTYFDNISFSAKIVTPGSEPETAAPTPTVAASDVTSIFSDAYTNAAGTDFNPNWGQSTVVSQVSIEGNTTLKYANLNYQGTQLASAIDVSGKTTLHLDYWTSDATTLEIYPISISSGEQKYSFTVTKGEWVSTDIPLSHFTDLGLAFTDIHQFKVVGNGTVFLDNLYFSSGTAVSALPVLPLDFESSDVNYTFTDFEGGVVTVIDNPQSSGINTSATVGKMVKNSGAVYAGSLITLDEPIDFSVKKTFKVKVFAPKVGAKLLLKVENISDASKNFEKEVTGTVANAWEELTFDYSAINTANQYQKIILIFDLGTAGDGSANFTYLFDDIKLIDGDAVELTQPVLPLDFESATVNYEFTNFEGGVVTTIANPQSSGINTSATVGKMVKNPGAVYAGSLITLAAPIDFSVNKTFKVKVFAPKVGAKLLLKVENISDASKNFEKEVTGTVANAWEELTFDYSAINTANQYQKIILIFDLGTAGDGSANFTYLFDDIKLIDGGAVELTQPVLPLDFESATVNYEFTNFEGGVVTTIANPQSTGINTSTKVGKMVKNPGAVYAGSLITLATPIDFSVNKTFKVKVFAPKVGAKLLLKVENISDASKNFEKEVTGTVANAWEELTFDYSAINMANEYQKIVLIFDLGTSGDGGANFTYLFDDIKLIDGGAVELTQPVLPLDFESSTVNYEFTNFEGGVVTVIDNPHSTGINTSTKVAKMVKNPGAVYAGSLIELAAPIDFSTNKTFQVKVFAPKVGAKLLLKVENADNPATNFEKEVTGTVANAWEDLSFDYSAISTTNEYSKIVLIFDLGTVGDGGANFTYLFDDIRLPGAVHDQTITFPAITDKKVGDDKFNLTATASSGLAVAYSTTSDKITIAGAEVTIVKAGRVSITAAQSGNASFNAATPVDRSFCIAPAKPVITFDETDAESITLTSSATAGNQWFVNGEAISGATNATLAATSEGTYTVQVSADDCVSEFSLPAALFVTGLSNPFEKVQIYPNPVENELVIYGISGDAKEAIVFDVTGKSIGLSLEKRGTAHYAPVQQYSPGLYFVRVVSSGKTQQLRMIKK